MIQMLLQLVERATLIVLIGLGGPVLAAGVLGSPLLIAYSAGRRRRARVQHKTERALALMDAEDDGVWLEIGNGDPCALPPGHHHSSCREADPVAEYNRRAQPTVPERRATPESLLDALCAVARLPEANTPEVATDGLIDDILDEAGFHLDHPGRAAARAACLRGVALSAAPLLIAHQ